jgi:hypothetical protein
MSKKRKKEKSQKRKAKKDHVLFCSWGEQKAAKPTQEKAKDESIS